MRFFRWLFVLGLIAFGSLPTKARDGWEDRPSVCNPAEMGAAQLDRCHNWVAAVRQHDTGISCCADGDAYLADDIVTIGGAVYAVVTGNYPNVQVDPEYPAIVKGSKILIPPGKMNNPRTDGGTNQTGHGVVFASPGSSVALCYFAPTLS